METNIILQFSSQFGADKTELWCFRAWPGGQNLHWDRNKHRLNGWGRCIPLRFIHNNSVSLPVQIHSTMIDDPWGLELLMLSIDGGLGRDREKKGQKVAVATYSEDMKEDSGPTSFAFWSACFSLKAASASSSSWLEKEPKAAEELFLISRHN